MIQPVQKDETLLHDIRSAEETPDALRLWWLGQSGYLVQWQGQHLLLDPYLSDSLTKKYANTAKPHIRMTERAIAPERLNFIDVVTSSHNHKFIGLIVEVGPWTIYHSGDTVLYDGMVETLRRWSIDLALLPINGRDPKRGVAGNLSGIEAAQLGKDTGAKLVIPGHYDLFEFNTVTPEEFIQHASAAGQPYRLLQCGERIDCGK